MLLQARTSPLENPPTLVTTNTRRVCDTSKETEVPPATHFAERIRPLFFETVTNQANAARTNCLLCNRTVDISYRGYWCLSQPTQKYTYKPQNYELELLAMLHSNLVKINRFQ